MLIESKSKLQVFSLTAALITKVWAKYNINRKGKSFAGVFWAEGRPDYSWNLVLLSCCVHSGQAMTVLVGGSSHSSRAHVG